MSLEQQEELLKDIGKNIVETNSNIKETSREVGKQGDQIKNAVEKLAEADTEIIQSNSKVGNIERRKKICKLVLTGIIALEIFLIALCLIKKIIK